MNMNINLNIFALTSRCVEKFTAECCIITHLQVDVQKIISMYFVVSGLLNFDVGLLKK